MNLTPLPHQSRGKLVKTAGFTLLEIMITVAISSVLVGGGVSAYRIFADRQVIVSAGQGVVVKLREVQKRAQSGEKPQGCVDAGETLDGWRIKTTSDKTYQVSGECGGSEYNVESHNLPQGTNFETDDEFDVFFEVLTGRMSGAEQRITIEKDSSNYEIIVSPAGGVSALGVQD